MWPRAAVCDSQLSYELRHSCGLGVTTDTLRDSDRFAAGWISPLCPVAVRAPLRASSSGGVNGHVSNRRSGPWVSDELRALRDRPTDTELGPGRRWVSALVQWFTQKVFSPSERTKTFQLFANWFEATTQRRHYASEQRDPDRRVSLAGASSDPVVRV